MSIVDEVFSDLCPEPLGAASLAQVHRARLRKDSSEVAVKIQHPDVRRNGYTDMDTIDVSSAFHKSPFLSHSLLPSLPPHPTPL